jgi:hypothetical protein
MRRLEILTAENVIFLPLSETGTLLLAEHYYWWNIITGGTLLLYYWRNIITGGICEGRVGLTGILLALEKRKFPFFAVVQPIT